MAPPHSLNEMLGQMRLSAASGEAVDAAIEGNPWARKFRDFLARRDKNGGRVAALRFLVLTHSLDEGKKNKTFADVFVEAGRLFFSEESDPPVNLSNSVLFDSISEALARVERAGVDTVKAQDLDNLRKARRDINIRQNGLDPHFVRFIAQEGHSSPMACLLSIL